MTVSAVKSMCEHNKRSAKCKERHAGVMYVYIRNTYICTYTQCMFMCI